MIDIVGVAVFSVKDDYLARLYYVDGYSYRYVEAFLKMFYLIFGQAYSRGYTDGDFRTYRVDRMANVEQGIDE